MRIQFIRGQHSRGAMSSGEREDPAVYTAVVNGEEQYSIWSADREFPLGWRAMGMPGSKQGILA